MGDCSRVDLFSDGGFDDGFEMESDKVFQPLTETDGDAANGGSADGYTADANTWNAYTSRLDHAYASDLYR